jgi:hypothetical protein
MIWLIIGLVVTAVLQGAIAAAIADKRGGEGVLGFFAGLMLGPFGIIWAFYMGNELERERRLVEDGYRKQCHQCFELVKPKATICHYCGNDFTALDLRIRNRA